MKTTFRDEEAHLLITCKGTWKPDAVKELLMSIKEQAIQTSTI